MVKKIFAIGIVCIILFMGLSNASSIKHKTAAQNTITVDDEENDGDYTSIQDAINVANDGDIIEVYSGTYYELISIDKQIILKGIDSELGSGNDIGNPVIDNEYTSTEPIIKVKANNVEITGFIIEDFHKWRDSSGIKITSDDNKIMYNVIRKTKGSHGGSAIWISGRTNNEIAYNEIYSLPETHTVIYNGIEIEGGYNNIVHHNIIRDVSCGVHFNILYSDLQEIFPKDNKVYRNNFLRSSFHLKGYDNLASENYFEKDGMVMNFEDCHHNIIYRNNFYNYENGIWIWDAVNNDIIENNFINSDAYFLLVKNIYFDEDLKNNWDRNYWNEPRILPYAIEGEWYIVTGGPTFKGYRYDNHPANELYTIPTGANQKPSKPSTPDGPNSGIQNTSYTYTCSGADPDTHHLYYLFDWGDDSNSGWIGPYNSGEVCEASHSWTEKGNYNIIVKTKDIYDYESEWSNPLTLSMPKNKATTTHIMRFKQNNPYIFRILQQLLQRLEIQSL